MWPSGFLPLFSASLDLDLFQKLFERNSLSELFQISSMFCVTNEAGKKGARAYGHWEMIPRERVKRVHQCFRASLKRTMIFSMIIFKAADLPESLRFMHSIRK